MSVAVWALPGERAAAQWPPGGAAPVLPSVAATPAPVPAAGPVVPAGTAPQARLATRSRFPVAVVPPVPPAEPEPRRQWRAAQRRAEAQLDRALALADRGALYAARSQFRGVLETVAQAEDIVSGSDLQTTALAAAWTALEEAEDLRELTPGAPDCPSVATIVQSHRTPVLQPPRSAEVPPHEAVDRYDAFAIDQFVRALRGRPSASHALHGLSKLYSLVGSPTVSKTPLGRGRSIALGRAAVQVHPENYLAVNDLAVLLSSDGRQEEARDLLAQTAHAARQPAVWDNLARLHERLGERHLAACARAESARLAAQGPANALVAGRPVGGGLSVLWVAPEEFAGQSPRVPPAAAATAPSRPAVQRTNAIKRR